MDAAGPRVYIGIAVITEPRLSILNPTGFKHRARRAAIEKMFGGFYPAAIHVTLVKTQLDRSKFDRWRIRSNRGSHEWSRPEMELFGAFVSARNHCVF